MSGNGNVRRARPSDNTALLDLFQQVPMTGNLGLITRRNPNFFALYACQRGLSECWVYEEEGQLGSMGTILIRDGWLDGAPCRVGYLGDLRSRFLGRRRQGVARLYGEILDDARKRYDCDVFLTAVLASNSAALNSLVRRRRERRHQPYYHLLRRFAAVAMHWTHRRRRPKAGAFAVRRATPADIPAIAALLDADHRTRPFGYRFDQGELQHRLACWPGLAVEQTYLALNRDGQLVGCTSAWDPSALKRYNVTAYRGSMIWVKRGVNALATVLGSPRLPEPGASFRALYLCNTSIRNDDPAILHVLLEHIYADYWARGYHFALLCLYDNDPLTPALRGFVTRALDFHLYAVTSSSTPRTTYPEGRPGFEMVLA